MPVTLGQAIPGKLGHIARLGSAISSNLFTQREKDWLPFELRPVITYQNTLVNHYAKPNSYAIGFGDDSIALIFDDRIVNYKFDDTNLLAAEISRLEKAGFRKMSFDVVALTLLLVIIAGLGIALIAHSTM
ncbi:hypothetical protein [Shinella zoogloeoides]|uniref:hypothetical protein n=1 Tax=Shinella zoogloeoides TaxID=352475 RepID=UPI00299DC632|nr:hypothetical protein [Shinella zoogloeoides]